jgi:hypothetical protein
MQDAGVSHLVGLSQGGVMQGSSMATKKGKWDVIYEHRPGNGIHEHRGCGARKREYQMAMVGWLSRV